MAAPPSAWAMVTAARRTVEREELGLLICVHKNEFSLLNRILVVSAKRASI